MLTLCLLADRPNAVEDRVEGKEAYHPGVLNLELLTKGTFLSRRLPSGSKCL